MRGWFVGMTRQPFLYRTTTKKASHRKAIITYLIKSKIKRFICFVLQLNIKIV